MPIKKCTENGQEGWSWGNGKCFIGKNAKKEAIKQAIAIGKGKFPEDIDDSIKDMVEELEKEYEDVCKNKKDESDIIYDSEKKVIGFIPPPYPANMPKEAVTILIHTYANIRKQWVKEHPNDPENKENKIKAASIAWNAVKEAGYKKNKEGKWSKDSIKIDSNWEYEAIIKNKVDKIDSVNRFDVFELTEDNMVEPFRKTPEGYLRGRAIVTNTGIFNYIQSDGSILRELRTPEDIGNQETLDSLIMQVMTDNHPKGDIAPNGSVNADNAKELQVGFTGENVRFDGMTTSIPITITDGKTIEKIEKEGKIALSCGYVADLEMRSGFAYGNNQYDAVQKNIKYNHIAIVDRGRAGDLAKLKLRMDSNDAVYINSDVFGDNNTQPKKENKTMAKIRLNDNVEFEVDKRVEDEFNTIKKTNEDLDKSLKVKNDELSTLQGKYDSLVADNAKLKEDKEKLEKEIPIKIDNAVKDRITIVDTAVKFGLEIKEDMNNLDIKKEVIKKAYADMNLEDKDENYISSVFDAAIITLNKSVVADNKEKILNIQPSKTDKVDADELRNRRIKNAWKLDSEQGKKYREGIIDEDMKKILDEEVK